MTFQQCGFHSIFSGYRKMSALRRSQCSGEPRACVEICGGDWQVREDPGCWLAVQLSQPGGHAAARASILQARGSWCCWRQARASGGDVPASQHSCTRTPGRCGRAGPRRIWSLTAVAITHFGFIYCRELMNCWLVITFIRVALLKRIYKWFQV